MPLVVIDHEDESISSTIVSPEVLRRADLTALAFRIRWHMTSAVRVRIFGSAGEPYPEADTDEPVGEARTVEEADPVPELTHTRHVG